MQEQEHEFAEASQQNEENIQQEPEKGSPEPETQEPAPEPEQENQESEQEEEKPYPERNPYKTLLNRNERERYRLKQENEQLKQQLEETARLNALSSEAASFHYKQSVDHKLREAQDRYSRAVQEGDAESQIKANQDIVESMSEKHRIEQKQAEQKLYQEYYQPPQRQTEPEDILSQLNSYQMRETVNWQRQNAGWFNPNSPHYDPELAQLADDYSEMKALEYQRRGEPFKVLSGEYFNDLNKYINSVRQDRGDPAHTMQQERRPLVMKPSNQYVSPITNRSAHSYQKPKERQLTRQEYNMAKELRIDPEIYRKQIVNLEKLGQYKRG
jgi:hypothetical protein